MRSMLLRGKNSHDLTAAGQGGLPGVMGACVIQACTTCSFAAPLPTIKVAKLPATAYAQSVSVLLHAQGRYAVTRGCCDPPVRVRTMQATCEEGAATPPPPGTASGSRSMCTHSKLQQAPSTLHAVQ